MSDKSPDFAHGVSDSQDGPAYTAEQLEHNLRLLAHASSSLARDIDPETMLAYAVRGATGGTHSTKGVMLLYDGEVNGFRGLLPGVGLNEAVVSSLWVASGSPGATENCFASGEVLVTSRPAGPQTGAWELDTLQARNLLIAPVRHGGKCIGVLYLADKIPEYGPFADIDEVFVRALLYQLESALQAGRLREQLSYLAAVDPTTGLYNQRFFDEIVALEVQRAERLRHPLGCAIIEIADFAEFVEREGVWPLDNAVRHVGEIVKRNVRKIDVIARYDVGAIVTLLPGAALEGSRIVATRLLARVRDSEVPKLAELNLRTGLSCYPVGAKSARELISSALKDARAAAAPGAA